MLSLLKIRNIALIDDLAIEFGAGLNLLTGETGSGKSIIVDSLSALTGERVSSDLIRQGADSASIEGSFTVEDDAVAQILDRSGIAANDELIVRRELSLTGKNRVYVNDQLVTQALLRSIGLRLVDIHGQGEQAALYDVANHIAMLDAFAATEPQRAAVARTYQKWSSVNRELAELRQDEAEKLQLVDILRFQTSEIDSANLVEGEEVELEHEKRRLANAEKLSTLSDEVYTILYESDSSTVSTLERASKKIRELGEFEARFAELSEGLTAASAVIEDAGMLARDFRAGLEFSPDRLNEIETRLAEISRLTRKYGGSVEAVLAHLRATIDRLDKIERAEFREEELRKQLADAAAAYESAATSLTRRREAAATKFSKAVEAELALVALEKARFEARIEHNGSFSSNGSDRVEFFFSANPGEHVRPLAKVASGGEASRLMLILKTVSRSKANGKTAVFDEIDAGIGGRVADAVGRRLKALSAANTQVFCVSHQPQIASLADHHFVVKKEVRNHSTRIAVHELSGAEKVDELARMLAGEQITEAARENAKAMLAAAK